MKKLTDVIIDNRIKDRSIKRLEPYECLSKKTSWLCLLCDYIWNTSTSSILAGSGCLRCSNKIKLTDEVIDEALIGRKIKRSEPSKGSQIPIGWLCEVCFNEWMANPSSVISGKTGCMQCHIASTKLSKEYINEILLPRKLELVGEFQTTSDKSDFKCLECDLIWKTKISSVFHCNRGCPKCSNCYRRTYEEVNQELFIRNIKLLTTYKNNIATLEDFQCLLCNNVWATTLNHIFNQEQGCPECNSPTINQKRMWQILEDNNLNFEKDFKINKLDNSIQYRYSVDVYLKMYNSIIEYNGAQHYHPVMFPGITQEEAEEKFIKQQFRDQFVDKWAHEKGINIFWIDGRIYKGEKLKEYLINEIIPLILKSKSSSA